jgi:hypothetical protein
LSEQLRASDRLLRWCAQSSAAAQAESCGQLQTAAAQAGEQVLAASHGQPKVEELRVSLAGLQAQMGRVGILAEAAPATSDADAEAAMIRAARQLPAGLAQHSVPEQIDLQSAAVAVVTVDHVPADVSQLLGRLSAHLTVSGGDAISVAGPRMIRQSAGALRWEWTLVGAHAGQAYVRTEVLIDPPAGSGTSLTPVHYETWNDQVKVQPSTLASVQAALQGPGAWWLLIGGAAVVLIIGGGLLLNRRHADRQRPGTA